MVHPRPDESLADFALGIASQLGAGYCEVRIESTTSNGFILKNGVPQIAGFDRLSGISVRFVVDNALGFMATNHLDRAKLKSQLGKAVKITCLTASRSEKISLADEKSVHADYSVKEKEPLSGMKPREKLSILLDAEKAVLDTKANVPSRYLSLSDFVREKLFMNSEGSVIRSRIPRTSFNYLITVAHGDKSCQRYQQYGASGGFEALNPDLPAIMRSEVLAADNNLRSGRLPPEGNVDLICAPNVVGIMVHESVGHPYEADRILGREAAQAGESFVTKEMLNTRIGSEAVNVSDDPTLPSSFGLYLYDDEGVQARKKRLISKGIITEFLHNRETAASLGIKSNAASRAASFEHEPIIRMSNTFMEPGSFSEEELIEGVKLGVYIKNFMEWNIDDRRLNQKYVGSEAYLIKNGRLTTPVFKPMIEIDTPRLYSSIDAVAKNLEFSAGTCGKGEPMQGIPVTMGGPSIRLRNIRLAKSIPNDQ
ncbi:TldD/PmbA family protein [Candidatus Woesearchaeota archaeon CG08_land_8_20_14_0_20_47_9]|nr:MAG: hypothetical protein AUJ69_03240 [Candidatus Woesearchaeota archaeon CG1_02_47_18]PIO03468.1 MAG: TldD/PmbA family protein [Candidatus Woesearchaeota archaeon CG08_land_8_20_14_0_20_47_9]HII30361.1 TldD/PmbA family protein [Candidatus Woesearchaeota archaeon]